VLRIAIRGCTPASASLPAHVERILEINALPAVTKVGRFQKTLRYAVRQVIQAEAR